MVYPIEASSRSSFRYCVDVSPDSSLRHHETRKNTAGKAYDLRIGTALAKSAGYHPSNVSNTAGDRDGFPPRTHAMNSAMERTEKPRSPSADICAAKRSGLRIGW